MSDLNQEEVAEILKQLAKAKNKKNSKFRNQSVTIDGKWFQSKREGSAYVNLCALERGGRITDLKTQVQFKLVIDGLLIATYRADFTYLDLVTGLPVVADAKGFKTEAYKIKKRLMRAIFNIDILEL